MSSAIQMGEDDLPLELQKASDWDIACRYHEFKVVPAFKPLQSRLRKISAQSILEKAQGILGAVVHPSDQKISPLSELPYFAQNAELAIDETLENSPHLLTQKNGLVTDQDVWMEYSVRKKYPLVLSVDTSLSMTGEKLALTAVALAVVLLQFPNDPVGIVAFENEAKVLKFPEEKLTLPELLERFLDVPAQGYTYLEAGLKEALSLSRRARVTGYGNRCSTILLTDGKYTAGKDPVYLAPRFSHLVVLKMGRERSSLPLCQDLARLGQGSLKEIGELEELPQTLYTVVKDLLRGRSL